MCSWSWLCITQLKPLLRLSLRIQTEKWLITGQQCLQCQTLSQDRPVQSPLSHMHDVSAPYLFPQSAMRDALNISLMVMCVWRKHTIFHQWPNPSSSNTSEACGSIQRSSPAQFCKWHASPHLYMLHTPQNKPPKFLLLISDLIAPGFIKFWVKNMRSSPSQRITVHKWKGFQATCSV